MSGKRVAVVGVGSVGGVFAAHLSAVHDVVACVRRPFDEYVVESAEVPFRGPANAVTSVDTIPWTEPADAVFVGLKAQHTDGAAEWFAPLCGPQTLVVVMQNGIEGHQRLEPYANGAAVVPAVVYCGAELVAPGHIEHSSQARLIVGDTPDGHRVRDLCNDTP
ncbi:MAG: ketopantoate reductase family protein, partial [Acidimicrobiales bacterium]